MRVKHLYKSNSHTLSDSFSRTRYETLWRQWRARRAPCHRSMLLFFPIDHQKVGGEGHCPQLQEQWGTETKTKKKKKKRPLTLLTANVATTHCIGTAGQTMLQHTIEEHMYTSDGSLPAGRSFSCALTQKGQDSDSVSDNEVMPACDTFTLIWD